MLVSPELADVLSSIVTRLRGPSGAIALVPSYDIRERVWNPPMPLLFQRAIGNENRPYTPSAIRKLLIDALAATELTGVDGEPLIFSQHDFRRIFVTDAIMSGLPPHIAQILCGQNNSDNHGVQGRLPQRGDRGAPRLHRPPSSDQTQPGIPNPDRRGMGPVPRPLREAVSVGRHVRSRLRNTVSA